MFDCRQNARSEDICTERRNGGMDMTQLACRCGTVRLEVCGPHIASVACLCDSCRTAAQVLEALPDAAPVLDGLGATPFVMHRKDRARITAGQENVKTFRLSDTAGTRRVVADCCNTPIFLDLKGGHWLSIYAALWPNAARPALEMRTMAGTRNDLPDDVPNLTSHSLAFFARLLGAWVRMGFRNPVIADNGALTIGPR